MGTSRRLIVTSLPTGLAFISAHWLPRSYRLASLLPGVDLPGWRWPVCDACDVSHPDDENAMPGRLITCPYRPRWLASRIVILVHLGIIICVPPAMADGLRTVAGAGTSLCSTFLREYDQDPQITAWIYLSWAQGYLSAVNLQRAELGEGAVDILPFDFGLSMQTTFLHAYCRNWPDRRFDRAAVEMYRELRVRHPPASDAQQSRD